ncbi:GNAT family N-acyltransferase [uncultured Porphyromonas sp.]|uniref:GNAT family N-acyltransferase n=1 Tax=uncultured Porphyromonas sp. TaxID=159274 RepID=UPI00263660BD|nr:GNAT family N-acyltransferase [uncultured Porphyromonas sp.]
MRQNNIIPPIDPRIIRSELHEQLMLRKTNRAKNELYTFHANEAPNTMLEIGRLREEAFRAGGGGTGKAADIDELDLRPNGYQQLVVWDPEAQQILGGYRYILCKNAIEQQPDGTYHTHLSSGEIFKFDPLFIKEYLPKTIELGRSFVTVENQNTALGGTKSRLPRSIFTLDTLWDGLGALMLLHDDCQYFFGKVTMYQSYNTKARDLIYYYLDTYFTPKLPLVTSKYPIEYHTPIEQLRQIIIGQDHKKDYKSMSHAIREMGTTIPPLVNTYIGLSEALMVFGSSYNPFFGDVLETAIMIPMEEITPEKKKRHINSFLRDAPRTLSGRVLQRIKQRLLRLNRHHEPESDQPKQGLLPHL